MIGSNRTDSQISQSRALLDAGRLVDANVLAETLLLIAPGRIEVKKLLVDIALKQGNGRRAIELLGDMIASYPNNHEFHGKAGVAFAIMGDLGIARNHLLQALQIKPDYLYALIDLCKVARSLGIYDESIRAGTRALAIEPEEPALHSNLALSYELYGLYRNAQEHYVRAATLCPDDAEAQQKAGAGCLFTGEKAQAKRYFEKAIALNPRLAQAYRGIAVINKYNSTNHDDFARVQAMLDTPEITDEIRCQCHFALGKMYDDCGDYDRAFEHFSAGNQLENDKYDFNPVRYRSYVDRLITAFSSDRISQMTPVGNSGKQPVFIVGMPRSGTTLVEHILSCHPQVYGAGELPWFTRLENALPLFLKSTRPYPDCIEVMTEQTCALLAGKYLDYVGDLSKHGVYTYITDKMPDNYERLGLIWMLFPNARIIHCKRDPLDNSVSQFNLLFSGRYDYSYDLFNLGAHHVEKERLMAHWRAVRSECFLDIDYEALVRDQERQTRHLLDFLNLPWNEKCLRFFESDRSVHTASHSQVCQPMYTSSVNRWKNYEKYLEPLHRGLRWQQGGGDE